MSCWSDKLVLFTKKKKSILHNLRPIHALQPMKMAGVSKAFHISIRIFFLYFFKSIIYWLTEKGFQTQKKSF